MPVSIIHQINRQFIEHDVKFVIQVGDLTKNGNDDGVAPGNWYLYGYSIFDQQSWLSARLDKRHRGTLHAFVFTHQPLIAENHQDSPFAGYANANPQMQNIFLACLKDNGVK